MCFVVTNYSLLYDDAQTLKQQLATGVSCNGKMEQSLIYANMNVLGYMDALYLKAAKS